MLVWGHSASWGRLQVDLFHPRMRGLYAHRLLGTAVGVGELRAVALGQDHVLQGGPVLEVIGPQQHLAQPPGTAAEFFGDFAARGGLGIGVVGFEASVGGNPVRCPARFGALDQHEKATSVCGPYFSC